MSIVSSSNQPNKLLSQREPASLTTSSVIQHNFHIIIPARYASQRLPGKPLVDVHGKPLIQRVYEQAQRCKASSVTVATDEQRIYDAVQAFGGAVCMTSVEHSCGTARLAEAVDLLGLTDDAIVVNWQGDEPLIPENLVANVANELANCLTAEVATLATPLLSISEIFDPNVVKVVLTAGNFALLFSRAPIPWHRDNFVLGKDLRSITNCSESLYFRHLGIYAYRAKTLRQFNSLAVSPLEQAEYLEQLRFLWHGKQIKVAVIDTKLPPGVDTADDLAKLRYEFRSFYN